MKVAMLAKSKSFFVAVAACAGLSSAAAAQAPTSAGPTPSAGAAIENVPASGDALASSSGYVLGRDDVIEVTLVGRTDYGNRARVQADGSIQLPLIGRLQVAERSTTEVADAVRAALKSGGFFADPIVSVEVVAYASRYVTVLGAVGSPGLVPMNRPYRISEILARVGSVRADAADYLIIRTEKGEEKRLPIKDLATGDLTADPYVAPGDKIYAPLADQFYIYGAVQGPGAYALTGDMTVRQALARGGGLTEAGSDKKVSATRGGKKVKLKLDDKLQPGDVLVVGERLF